MEVILVPQGKSLYYSVATDVCTGDLHIQGHNNHTEAQEFLCGLEENGVDPVMIYYVDDDFYTWKGGLLSNENAEVILGVVRQELYKSGRIH